MNKYEGLKYWARVKARVLHECEQCGAVIQVGQFYYKQRIDLVNPPPRMVFGQLCEQCHLKADQH